MGLCIKKKCFVVFEIVGRVFTTQRDTRTLQKGRAHTLLAIFGKCASGRGARILQVQIEIRVLKNTKNLKFRVTLSRENTSQRDSEELPYNI